MSAVCFSPSRLRRHLRSCTCPSRKTCQSPVLSVQSFSCSPLTVHVPVPAHVCVCPMRLLACVCVPRLLIRALDDDLMCRVSFTPVRARDTVKLIEPKHSFACGFPPKKTRPKNQVINILHVKACCCCQWVVGFFFNFIVQQRGNSSREQNPLSSPACVSICAVCVCVVYG